MVPRSKLDSISPFFIADSLADTLIFYEKLGFTPRILAPEENPFFAIIQRDTVEIIVKETSPDTRPQPNSTLHEWARWDAFIRVSDPDSLFSEFKSLSVSFHEELANTDDGLRAFEIKDNNGYILCFAKPLSEY